MSAIKIEGESRFGGYAPSSVQGGGGWGDTIFTY